MASINDITGDSIQTKISNKSYEDGWNRIFGHKEKTLSDIADEHPNATQFDELNQRVVCKNCQFKNNINKEPPPVLCQSCGTKI